ncbi:MAG: hypothetical protein JW810_06255 [Sedimentisphaerales bacterium]|nr:hypothetical protein [Sedimentisphaerales bacterium]
MSKKGKFAAGIIAAAALLAVLGVTIWAVRRDSRPALPDLKDASVQEKAEFLASDDFGKLEVERKQQYLETLRPDQESRDQPRLLAEPDLTDEQRDQLIKNLMPVIKPWVEQRAAEYEALTPAEQTARLDQIIDRMEEQRRSNPQQYRERMRRLTPERVNMFLEHTDPKTRVKIAQFRTNLEKRMKERGVPIDW